MDLLSSSHPTPPTALYYLFVSLLCWFRECFVSGCLLFFFLRFVFVYDLVCFYCSHGFELPLLLL